MDALCIVAVTVGVAGLLGGFLWGWGATRTASRVAFKIVEAAGNAKPDPHLEARLAALEHWKYQADADGRGARGPSEHG
ncbi:hypothetical protein [Candidatus Poriferisodalis sp.]|uniref:hypothetical protein n=1 Tax=Candidatus Poriferisodalis sp. TaxID=3101277 RepID=UPI003B01E5F4